MSSTGSITYWLRQWIGGERAALQKLWEAYFTDLVRLVRKKLRGTRRQVVDEEDVALNAFNSFCKAAEQGRFPKLENRHDIWQLLVVIATRKAINQIRWLKAQKRLDNRTKSLDALLDDKAGDGAVFGALIDRKLGPAMDAAVADQCLWLLDVLGDDDLKRIALARMEGKTNKKIAVELDRSVVTIERKARLIRTIWSREIPLV